MNRIVLFLVIALVKSALGTALNTEQDVCSICFKTKTYTYTRRRRTFTRTSTTTLPHCTTTKHSKNYTSKKLQRKKKHRHHHHKSTTTHLSATSTISNSTPTSIKSRSLFIPTETSLSPLVITTSTLASTSTSTSMSTSTSTSMSTSPPVSSSLLIPTTTSSMLPIEPTDILSTDIMPADLTPTPVIPISNNLVLSGNNPPNKALGIGLGICIGSVAAFALVGLLYLSKRSKPHTATDPGQINTKWRPQSFMNVVASVVAKLPRSPSQRSK